MLLSIFYKYFYIHVQNMHLHIHTYITHSSYMYMRMLCYMRFCTYIFINMHHTHILCDILCALFRISVLVCFNKCMTGKSTAKLNGLHEAVATVHTLEMWLLLLYTHIVWTAFSLAIIVIADCFELLYFFFYFF